MNKKVFALLAASLMLLLGAVGASARPAHGDSVKYLPDGTGKGAYHLKISYIGATRLSMSDSCFLIMDQEGRIDRADSAYVWNKDGDPDSAFFKLRSSLWCVNVARPENAGKVPAFTFINKEYGTELAFDYQPHLFTDTGTTSTRATIYHDWWARLVPGYGIDLIAGQTSAPLVGGNLSKWKFSRTYNGAHGSAELEKDQYLAIEVKPDYYLTFAVPSAGTSQGKIRLVVAHKNEFADTSSFYKKELVRFRLVNASPRVLTAHDFNTKMHQNPTEGPVQLFFSPDVTPGQTNAFAQLLKATDVQSSTRGKDNHYLYLNTTGGQYITMSTSDYNSDLGIRYPKIETTGATNEDQSKWRLVYYPSEDSLIINVKGYKNHVSYGTQKDPSTGSYSLNEDLYNSDILNYLIVRVQDLNATAGRVLTVANAPANTRIHFNINNCVVYDTDRTTVPSNLYTVRDREGRYLVVPMYAGDLTPQWMRL